MGQNVVDIDERLRIVGTAHVSSASVALVNAQIKEFEPDLVAVELCESRLRSLKKPDDLDSDDLLKIINEGRIPHDLIRTHTQALGNELLDLADDFFFGGHVRLH